MSTIVWPNESRVPTKVTIVIPTVYIDTKLQGVPEKFSIKITFLEEPPFIMTSDPGSNTSVQTRPEQTDQIRQTEQNRQLYQTRPNQTERLGQTDRTDQTAWTLLTTPPLPPSQTQ